MKHCYLFYGMGGEITSHGLDLLATKLGQLPDVVTKTTTYGDYLNESMEISKNKADTDKNILIGYSLGANVTTNVAMAVSPHSIDLLVAIDPSVWGYIYPLTGNVKKAICFHNTLKINVIGLARVPVGPNFDRANLTTVDIDELHLAVDYNAKIHETIIKAVEAL